MTSTQIRQSFLDFFKLKQHTIVPSSSLMPDSPNLLFTNAGMNQFVPIFLGQVKCPYNPPRAADTQKCIRAGGKHNDLDDVGLDTYHHTFFEMLGNWSFGDYFKQEAIEWAWELVTEVWKFPKNRIYATVYSPDKSKNDPSEFDQEAYDLWAAKFEAAGLDPKIHIVYGNKKDNFWMMGETGPCGPCSELHVDLTPLGDTKGSLVNKGDARCIEIWNLVFIQFNANPDGTFSPLPAKHVDTGMGFERATSIIQGTNSFKDFANAKISNYETDIFRPIFDAIEKLSGKKYGSTLPESPVKGSTGDSPVPLGDPPSGMGRSSNLPSSAGLRLDDPTRSAGPVAQQHGQVAHATQTEGSTGDSPVPVGDPPSGTGKPSDSQIRAGLQKDGPSHSAGTGARYSKRNLPHFEKPWAIYHVTFNTIEPRKLSDAARDVVFDCILHWRELRYRLIAGCVMPDHVHMIIQPGIKEEDQEGKPIFWSLTEILHSIKSYSAKEVNKLDHVHGSLWQQERYDRYMRSDADLQEKFHYVCRNPWAAGLVKEDEPWPWLWTPDIEAWKPYVPLSNRKGSTGDAPVPVGDPPSGTGRPSNLPSSAGLRLDDPTRSAGPVAQQHGQVAHATQTEGSTGDSPVPVGDPPSGTGRPSNLQSSAGLRLDDPTRSAGPVAQRHGQVAHATQLQMDIAFRVIADHIRTLSFAIADGIQPGNTDRNYVLRRILRRAVRYGRTLGFHEPFFYKLVDVLAETMGEVFPEIRVKKQHVQDVIRIEEEAFNKTLDNGTRIFDMTCARLVAASLDQINAGSLVDFDQTFDLVEKVDYHDWQAVIGYAKEKSSSWDIAEVPPVSAESTFQLYDTYGFPLDLTELMARERGLSVDKEGFERLMEEQRARARAAQKKTVVTLQDDVDLVAATKFVGFDHIKVPSRVLKPIPQKGKWAVILEESPFYAEMGGQVGDTGTISAGANLWPVVDTKKVHSTWLHIVEGDEPPAIGTQVEAEVNAARRNAIQRHHTVAHLMHWALHEVVSKEASQKGSFVGPDKLTFDFNSPALTPEQVSDVEKLVNERILENVGVSWTEVPHADVKNRKDVMQFFGDKYGDVVRVVQIGGHAGKLDGYSMELCGGTHTRATGEIGLFRIVGESAVAAGVRRIEAIAGLQAYQKTKHDAELIGSVAGKVNAPIAELEKKIEALLAHQKQLEKSLQAAKQKEAAGDAKALLAKAETVNDIPAIIANISNADGDTLQTIADALKGEFKGVVVLGGVANGAVSLVASVSPEFTSKIQAGKIIQGIAPIVGGKGGGKPDNARGGGKDAGKLGEALAKAKSLLG